MELAIPRYSYSSYGNMYIRTCENGSVGSWSGVRAAYATDADTVDGIHAGSFLRSDADDSFSGTLTSTKNGTAIIMDGGSSAEGVRMQADSSTTYPVFLRTLNPSGGGETSAWLFKENNTAWGIWHNNPINTIDFTRFVEDEQEPTLVQDGKLYLAELDKKQFTIREGDFIVLDKLKNFRIRKLYMKDQLLLTLQGRTGKLETGSQDFLYSRMPTWLDWLETNRFITLLLATIVPVFTALIVLLNRLRITEEL